MINYDEIEKTVDNWIGEKPECIVDILDAISQACNETANHLRTNWQDKGSAKQWERIAEKVIKLRMSIPEMLPF